VRYFSSEPNDKATRLAKYHVRIKSYTGPFDVLLQLIASKKIGIEDIDLSTLTQDYLNFLTQNIEEGIKLAPEFIQVASILILIKTNVVLNEPVANEDLEELPQSREDLLKSLKDLSIAKKLQSVIEPRISQNAFLLRAVAERKTVLSEKKKFKIDPYELLYVYKDLLERRPTSVKERFVGNHTFKLEEAEKIVQELLEEKEQFAFRYVMKSSKNKSLIIGCFLAILKLSKEGLVEIIEEEDDLIVRKAA
jgi:segregation and condensation protein A